MLMVDGGGNIVSEATREYPLNFPKPGWSEQNPGDWWDAVKDGLKELVGDVEKSDIKGISFGGQMHGLVIFDENDEVIRPAILWNDGRTQKECDFLNGEIGKEKISSYTANIAFAGFTAPTATCPSKHSPQASPFIIRARR